MPYRISFYGDRTPETINDEGGRELYNDYQQQELPEMVELREGLTVARRTIREIEYIRPQAENMVHTRESLKRFEQDKLGPFLDESGRLTFEQEWLFLEAEGLVRLEKHQERFKTASDWTVHIVSHLTTEYQKMVDKIAQWRSLEDKRNYAKKMEAKELDAVAASMKM